MKTTLDLPDDLVQELKLRSVYERRKLKDVAAAALRRGLQIEQATTATTASRLEPLPTGLVLNERGFPVFQCGSKPPAERMTAEELSVLEQKIIQEEDLKRVGVAP